MTFAPLFRLALTRTMTLIAVTSGLQIRVDRVVTIVPGLQWEGMAHRGLFSIGRSAFIGEVRTPIYLTHETVREYLPDRIVAWEDHHILAEAHRQIRRINHFLETCATFPVGSVVEEYPTVARSRHPLPTRYVPFPAPLPSAEDEEAYLTAEYAMAMFTG